MSRFTTALWRAPLASIAVLGAIAAPASANVLTRTQTVVNMLVDQAGGPIAGLTGGCDVQQADQVFAPWGDLAYYTLAPQGDFESATGWTLGGGATLTAQNSSFSTGAQALWLGGLGTATSPSFCVDVTQPTMRFFARNTGVATSNLKVEALFTDSTGKARALTIANLTSGSAWAPTAIVPLVVNQLASVSSTGTTSIQLRFTVTGAKGVWVLDDVEIDPFRPR
jgi:hypothetical protein